MPAPLLRCRPLGAPWRPRVAATAARDDDGGASACAAAAARRGRDATCLAATRVGVGKVALGGVVQGRFSLFGYCSGAVNAPRHV